jgi:hypothetical protein
MTQAVALLTCIRKVSGSNLNQHINNPNWGAGSWFFSVSPDKCRDRITNLATTASFYIFSKLFFHYHPVTQCYIT